MSTAVQPIEAQELLSCWPIYRLTVEQYHRMIQAGVFTENDPVELVEGLLVSKMPHSPTHDGTISILLRLVWTSLPRKWIVRVQSAITLETSEPEPDLAIVEGPENRYLAAHPVPSEIAAVMEVADTTLVYDQTVKARLYARAHIPVYWIVNLIANRVEVYSNPKGGKVPGYRQRDDYRLELGVPLVIDGKEVASFPVRRLFS